MQLGKDERKKLKIQKEVSKFINQRENNNIMVTNIAMVKNLYTYSKQANKNNRSQIKVHHVVITLYYNNMQYSDIVYKNSLEQIE